ncbi:hypothetical protein FRIGORI9N_430005 [Frigoribacterium sp. 9N]|nr:hypothetical protein FRIGORI9N_430005 [Frigoribacterium sp. 9N]
MPDHDTWITHVSEVLVRTPARPGEAPLDGAVARAAPPLRQAGPAPHRAGHGRGPSRRRRRPADPPRPATARRRPPVER